MPIALSPSEKKGGGVYAQEYHSLYHSLSRCH
jgi:hypothetical protein